MRILFAISDQRQRVDPGGTPIFFILVQQHLQSSDVVARKQGGRQQIADALIVVGIEDQHSAIMIDRRLLITQAPQRSEEHTSELQSLMRISYAVFCLKKTTTKKNKSKLNHT